MERLEAPEQGKLLLKAGVGKSPSAEQLTVDIAIPVFNEERCVDGVLQDVMTASCEDWFQVQHVYVISDASTDQTDELAARASRRDPRMQLIRKQVRKGKQDSINLAFSLSSADIIVLIDGDVRFANEDSLTRLLSHFRDGQTAVVQGGLVRRHPGFTLHPAKLGAYFDWIVVDKIRRRQPLSWWSVDGRLMALSRDFFRQLSLPCALADDQFIFYSCIQQDRKFVWAGDAVFYYGSPESIADFSHQWSRYFFYTNQSRQYFGEALVDKSMSVPGLWRTMASCTLRHPLCGPMWLLGYTVSRIEFMLRVNFRKYERGLFWTRASPLRNVYKGNGTSQQRRNTGNST